MKKTTKMMVIFCVTVSILTACGNPMKKMDKNTVYLKKDSTVESLSIEDFDKPYYKEEELKSFIDEEVTKMANFVVGANKKDYHLVNVNYKKDFDGTIGDYKKAKEGDSKGVENFARNLFKEQGRDFDKEFAEFRKNFR